MRILLVADVIGGVRTFTRELVRELERRGIEMHLALVGPHGAALMPGAASVEVRDLRLEWMDDAWDDVARTAEWVEQLRETHDPDVIHMNTFAPVHDSSVPVLLTVHSCVLTWWRAVHGHAAPASWERYRSLATRAVGRADSVVTPTHALLAELEDVYGPLPSAVVIPNGRSVDLPPGVVLGRRERLVVTVGRLWDQAKNAALLAAAAPRIDGRVALVGPGQVDGEILTGQVGGRSETRQDLAERDVLGWLVRAAVFAEPARYEPFGLAALEAALCGCALVLGDIPSLREVWIDAATFVPTDDPEVLAFAVNELLLDPARRAEAAQRARRRAVDYTPGVMAEVYETLYRQLARAAVSV